MRVNLGALALILSPALILAAGCVTDPGHEEPPVDPFTIEEINGDYSVTVDPLLTLTSTLTTSGTGTAEASVEELADGLELAGDDSTVDVAYDSSLGTMTIRAASAEEINTIVLDANQVYAYGANGYGIDETAYPEDVVSFGFRDVQLGVAVTGTLSNGCQILLREVLSMSFTPGAFTASVKGIADIQPIASPSDAPYVSCAETLEAIRAQLEDGLVDDTNRVFDIFVVNGALTLANLPRVESLSARLDFAGALLAPAGASEGASGSLSGQVEMLQGRALTLSLGGGVNALMRKLLLPGRAR